MNAPVNSPARSQRDGRPRQGSGGKQPLVAGLRAATRLAPYDALVLDAALRQSLVTVRSLGRRGLHVAALESAGMAPAFSSRWCRQVFHAPAFVESTQPYLCYLERLLEQTPARVLIASSDGAVALLQEHRERLERRTSIALARAPALALAINKAQTLDVAQRLGLGVPRAVIITAPDDVPAAIAEIGLPAVVKPVESWARGEGHALRLTARLVTSADETRRAVDKLTCMGRPVLFQQFLSGRCEAVSFLYARGHIYARFAQWAKRMEPPLGGTSVWRQSIALPSDLDNHAERLVREIGLEGYSEVEFRRDSSGRAYLMEINPRLSASVEVAVRAGVDFPYLLYQWASGQPVDDVKGYRTGVWMRYFAGDLRTTVRAVLPERGRPGVTPPVRAVRDFCATFFTPAGYDYVDWKDPLPACVATLGYAGHSIRQLTRLGKELMSKP
ncbi:MAG TPA: ATP-grasp domain-containing protein [Ktedonobacterales bacterium]